MDNMPCKFGCGTLVDKSLGSCEMCCEAACAERLARVEPLQKANEKEAIARAARFVARLDARRKAKSEKTSDALSSLEEKPKGRKARS